MRAQSSRSGRRRTALRGRVMPATGCCLAALGAQGQSVRPSAPGFYPSGWDMHGRAERELQLFFPEASGSAGSFCLLLSCFFSEHVPPNRSRTALIGPGGGWVISTNAGRGRTDGHAHCSMLMSSGLFTVSSHGGAGVPSRMEAKTRQD